MWGCSWGGPAGSGLLALYRRGAPRAVRWRGDAHCAPWSERPSAALTEQPDTGPHQQRRLAGRAVPYNAPEATPHQRRGAAHERFGWWGRPAHPWQHDEWAAVERAHGCL